MDRSLKNIEENEDKSMHPRLSQRYHPSAKFIRIMTHMIN